MNKFKIEKDVPVPSRKGIYPFDDMTVGDSILVTGAKKDFHRARNASSVYGKRHGLKFETRTVDGGLRIWRTG